MSETPATPQDPTLPLDRSPEPGTHEPVKRSRARALLIAGGSVLAAAVLAGGGIAIGAAIADDNDDDRTSSRTELDDDLAASTPSVSPGDSRSDRGATSADQLVDAVAAASAAAPGDAVSIDAEDAGGWEVKLRGADGTESEVRVDSDGTATVVSTAADDRTPTRALDDATLRSLVTAAQAEVDGRIVEIDADDDAAAYEVSIASGTGRTVDISVDESFTVIAIDD
ncbi:PepSY domain-containing protein [Microbacterium sp. RD1]|uniref:PepSY domain-containing protein n=1 Tax=Microbacterium sp. RD1 TaxID=3457313 RepID=UPI003FA5FDCE